MLTRGLLVLLHVSPERCVHIYDTCIPVQSNWRNELLPPVLQIRVSILFFLVNSGSEANDLAWRMAKVFTGNAGLLTTEMAYHGITDACSAMSPALMREPNVNNESHVERWSAPDAYRNLHLESDSFEAAIQRLKERNLAPAVAIMDAVLMSDGIQLLEPSYVQELVRLTHEAGGLWIADEVQGGHGRTGHMWGFNRWGITPDFITIGKPMGNGHPIAALITRKEIADRFAKDTIFFSTFGGNQVSCAAAHAVFDVMHDERIIARVLAAGDALRSAVRAVTVQYECVGDVRGVGLVLGLEIVMNRINKLPNPVMAGKLQNAMRRNNVMVGCTGPNSNVLKVRPPLAFTAQEVPFFIQALTASLREVFSSS